VRTGLAPAAAVSPPTSAMLDFGATPTMGASAAPAPAPAAADASAKDPGAPKHRSSGPTPSTAAQPASRDDSADRCPYRGLW
jgi:hypothetical protein